MATKSEPGATRRESYCTPVMATSSPMRRSTSAPRSASLNFREAGMVGESYRAKRTFASTRELNSAPACELRLSLACETHDDLRAHRHHRARCRSLLTRQAIAEQLHCEAGRTGAFHHLAYRGTCEGWNSHTMLRVGQQCAALRLRRGHSIG